MPTLSRCKLKEFLGNFKLKIISRMYDMMGTYYFAPTDEMDKAAAYDDCRDGAPYQEMCASDVFMIAGWNSVEMNRTMLPVLNAHSPAGNVFL